MRLLVVEDDPDLNRQLTKALTDAGILVHAYLMYGFPTQTVQDTVDALEYVRQLFENGCIQSGFFHRFAGKDYEDKRPRDRYAAGRLIRDIRAA